MIAYFTGVLRLEQATASGRIPDGRIRSVAQPFDLLVRIIDQGLIDGTAVVSLHHDISTLIGEEVVLFTLANREVTKK